MAAAEEPAVVAEAVAGEAAPETAAEAPAEEAPLPAKTRQSRAVGGPDVRIKSTGIGSRGGG